MSRDRLFAAGGVIALLLVAAAVGPLGANQKSTVIGVIDNDRVFAESTQGKAATEQIEANFSGWQTQITTVEGELSQMVNQRNQQAALMTSEALRQLDAEIEQKQVDLQRLRDDAQRQFTQIRNRILLDLDSNLIPAVQELAVELGYSVVFNRQTAGLLYFDPAVDITDAMIAKLNAMDE